MFKIEPEHIAPNIEKLEEKLAQTREELNIFKEQKVSKNKNVDELIKLVGSLKLMPPLNNVKEQEFDNVY